MMNNEISTVNQQMPSRQGFMKIETLEKAKEVAALMIETGIVPDFHLKTKNPIASIIMSLQKGAEVGLSPTNSVQDIANIGGRSLIWGDTALALCKVSSDYEYCIETFDEATQTATCKSKRKGEAECVRTFSVEDAKSAGLIEKPIYRAYRKRMLQMRARGFSIRDTWPHVLKGLHLAEEYIGVHKEVEINPIERTIANTERPQELKKPINEAIKDKLKANLSPQTYPHADLTLEPREPVEKVSNETFDKLRFLVNLCEVPETILAKWKEKAGIDELHDLTEEQAQKIIAKLEEEKA